MKNNKIKILGVVTLIIILIGYLTLNLILQRNGIKNLKELLKNENKQIIKKYILPYKVISQQEKLISQQVKELEILEKYIFELEQYREKGEDFSEISTTISSLKLSNKKI